MKPTAIARVLRGLIEMKMPTFIKGPVGAGKSSLVHQAAIALGMEMRDVRLSQMDPTDIKGFPCPDLVKKQMFWLPADFLPTKGKGVLFLDELTSAPQAVQASAYQLSLDRKVGNYTLPPGWAIVAAGNRDIDRSIVNRMPAALSNRFEHIDFDVDVDDWVRHAMDKGIGVHRVAFIRFRRNLLHSFDATQNPAAFPTPRSWFMADAICAHGFATDDEYQLLKGCVGEAAAAEYKAFVDLVDELPTVEEIKLNPDRTSVPEMPAAQYALTTSLAMATDDPPKFQRFMTYITRLPVEFQVVYVRDCLNRVKAIATDSVFLNWGLLNSEVVT